MLKIFSLFFIFFSLAVMAWADGRMLYYNGKPLDIHVATGRVTQVSFPEKVAKIIKGGGGDSVLVEVLDTAVFILPKKEHPADIFVTSISGQTYPLNLQISPTHDVKVDVAYAFDGKRSQEENRSDVIDLMKVLLQGGVPAGASVVESKEERLISDGQIQLILNTVFELPKLNGLILTAKNLTNNAVVLPIQGVHYPRLLAISSDQDTLTAKDQEGAYSKIYIVVGK